ncbi:MAG: hypothetical protein ACD_62C00563G0005 [uncultured bacterium]|nr:MAG: hypothetical protein ACD_62C00563G0005 [uncultured bacterium]
MIGLIMRAEIVPLIVYSQVLVIIRSNTNCLAGPVIKPLRLLLKRRGPHPQWESFCEKDNQGGIWKIKKIAKIFTMCHRAVPEFARVAELADALDSGSSESNLVLVQIQSRAHRDPLGFTALRKINFMNPARTGR